MSRFVVNNYDQSAANNINTQKGIEKILFFCVYRDRKKVLGVLMSTVFNDLTSGVYIYIPTSAGSGECCARSLSPYL